MADARVWGPVAWYFIHSMSFSFSQNKRPLSPRTARLVNSFYLALRWVLPCPSCKEHYGKTLKHYPPAGSCKSGRAAAEWGVQAHNLVNKGMGKELWSYRKALKTYHGKSLNYGMLQSFIRYMVLQSTETPLSNRKSMATCVIYLFPCNRCRPSLLVFLKKNPLQKVRTSDAFNIWAKQFYNHARGTVTKILSKK
jgi:hypothetical protein